MNIADQQKQTEDQIPARSVVAVLQEQHSQIRQLFAQVKATRGEDRKMSFDRLRELLAIHEVGEELVLRPVTERLGAGKVAEARNEEEKQAAKVLTELESLDVDSAEFLEKFTRFQKDVEEHATHEEREEFPAINAEVDETEQREMGAELLKAEQKAPTHPHASAAGSPAALRVAGPFAAMLDKARDSFSHNN